MQTTGTALLAVKRSSPVHMRTPAEDSRSAMGCCTLLLYGTIGTSKNTVKVALTLALPHSRLRGGQMTTWDSRTLMWSSRTSEDWELGMKQLNDLGMQGWKP